jgi:lipopolysaccharide export system permease protein
MNILDRYLLRATLTPILLVLCVLVGLSAFIETVGQMDDVGQGNYQLIDAITYVALRVPRAAFEMLPAAALLGALLGLGNLASRSELVVMRASGVSTLRLLGSVAIGGLLLVLVMALLGESIAPSLGQYARQMRATKLLADVSISEGQEIWLRQGELIVNLRQLSADFTFGGVSLFTVDGNSLKQIARADSADIDNSGRWLLRNYRETSFEPGQVTAVTLRQAVQTYELSPDLLGLSVVRPDLLATVGLWRYIGFLNNNGLDSVRYQVALWTRVANVISVGVMVVLALPFVFGSLRSTGSGTRMVVGLLVGLGYYLSTKMLGSSGEVFDLDPVLVAWAPTVLLLIITAVALSRVR